MTIVRPPTDHERNRAAALRRSWPLKRGHYRLSVPPNTLDAETMRQAVDVVLVFRDADGVKTTITTPKSKARRSHYYSALGAR